MASTPMTSGYGISVMPQIQFADPRYFNPYGELSAGITQGVKMAEDIQQMRLRKAIEEREREREIRAQEQAAYEMTRRPFREQMDSLGREKLERELNQPIWDGSTRRVINRDPTRVSILNNPFESDSLTGGGAPIDDAFSNRPLIGSNLSLTEQAEQERQSMLTPRFVEPTGIAQRIQTAYQPGEINSITEVQEGRGRNGELVSKEKTILDAYELSQAKQLMAQKERQLDIAQIGAESAAAARLSQADARKLVATGRWRSHGNMIVNDLTGDYRPIAGYSPDSAGAARLFMGIEDEKALAPTTLPQPAGAGEAAGMRLNMQPQSAVESQRLAQVAAANDAKAKVLLKKYRAGEIRTLAELEAAMVAAGLPR